MAFNTICPYDRQQKLWKRYEMSRGRHCKSCNIKNPKRISSKYYPLLSLNSSHHIQSL